MSGREVSEREGARPDVAKEGVARGWLLVALLAFALAALWGYGQYNLRLQMQRRAEASYRRAFHELLFNAEQLDSRLGQLLVANTRPMIMRGLEEVRVQAHQAHANLNQLPLATTPLPQLSLYLGRLNDFTRELSVKVRDGGRLEEKDWAALRDLRDRAAVATAQLNDLRQFLAAGRMNWNSLHRYSEATYDGDGKDPVLTRLGALDGEMGSRGESSPRGESGEPPAEGPWRNKPKVWLMGRPEISAQEAEAAARRFLADQLPPGAPLRLVAQAGGQWSSYRFEADIPPRPGGDTRPPAVAGARTPAAGGTQAGRPQRRTLRIDVARRGGEITWALADRRVLAQRISPEQAREIAERYLRSKNYPDMVFSSYEEYDNRDIGLVTFVYRQGDTLIYPDAIRVRVALDDGEVLGMTANAYVTNHRRRDLPSPALSEAQARQRVSPRLQVISVQKAVINDEAGDEVLVYEVRARAGDEVYKVFVNARTGDEERIERERDAART